MELFGHNCVHSTAFNASTVETPQENKTPDAQLYLAGDAMVRKVTDDSVYYSIRLPVMVTEEELAGLMKRIHSGEEAPAQGAQPAPTMQSAQMGLPTLQPAPLIFATGNEYDEVRAIDNARRLLKIYQSRERILGGLEFSDPAWLILLDLFTHGDKAASVSTACAASGVASSTALRYVTRLADAGLISRSPHPFDLRAIELKLTAKARQGLIKILS